MKASVLRTSLLALSLGAALAAHAQNLVVNGGFETGDLTGWTQVGDTVGMGVDGRHPHSGDFAAYFGEDGAGVISQYIPTVPGQTYLVELWLQSRPAGENTTSILFGNSFLLSTDDEPAYPYRHLSMLSKAHDAKTFFYIGFSNDRGEFDVDDVSIRAVPEPSALAAMGLPALALLRRRKRT